MNEPLKSTVNDRRYLAASSASAYSAVSMLHHFGPIMPKGSSFLSLSYLASEMVCTHPIASYPEYSRANPTIGALLPRGGPVQDPVLTPTAFYVCLSPSVSLKTSRRDSYTALGVPLLTCRAMRAGRCLHGTCPQTCPPPPCDSACWAMRAGLGVHGG